MDARARTTTITVSSLAFFGDAIIAVTRCAVKASASIENFARSHIKDAPMPAKKITRQDLRDAAEKYKNWGKCGPNDGNVTLNYTTAGDLNAAASVPRKRTVISLAINFEPTGPQRAKSNYPAMSRPNPIHTMIRTGTDAYSGVLDKRGIRAADDMVTMPLQCGTQWD